MLSAKAKCLSAINKIYKRRYVPCNKKTIVNVIQNMSIWVKTIYIFVAFILYVICKIKTFNFNCDSQPSLRNVLNTFLKFWLNSALVLTKTQFVSSPPKTSALLNFGPFPPLLRPPWGRTQTHATPRPRVPLHWYPISAQSRSDIEEG